MKKIITFLAIAFCLRANAQTYVTIPDANFVTYLQSIIPAAMSGNQLNTGSPLVTTTTQTITVPGLSISNLTGIQYFTSLTNLVCYTNSLTTLPTLPATLINLNCWQNQLTSLPALPNTLQFLDCSTNSLTSLPALPNSLVYLFCNQNQLTNLPALPNSLVQLNCTQNSLTTLPTLPNSLTDLFCGNNDITCFPTFPNSLNLDTFVRINPNPYTCLPNYVLPAMNSYTTTPLCAAGNTNGCPVSTAGIEQYHTSSSISIYPNPANVILNVELKMQGDAQNTSLQVTDILGKEVMQVTMQQEKTSIDISSLVSGVYFIKTTTGTQKFIKQ